MGVVGMLLVALVIGFLVMTNISSITPDELTPEASRDSRSPVEIDKNAPTTALDSVEGRVEQLLENSEDKYRDFDK